MPAKLRTIAEEIAEFIASDDGMRSGGNVSVVVEDKGDYGFQIAQALGGVGVCVTIAVTAFRRVENSPILQGTVEMQISCYEHPSLNRSDESNMTSQGAMERIAGILHYRKFNSLSNQLIFKDFAREDTDEANIVRGNFEANTLLVSPAAEG